MKNLLENAFYMLCLGMVAYFLIDYWHARSPIDPDPVVQQSEQNPRIIQHRPFQWPQIEVQTREEFDALDPGRQELLILMKRGIDFTQEQADWFISHTNFKVSQVQSPAAEPTPTPLPKERWVGGRRFILTDRGDYIVAPK